MGKKLEKEKKTPAVKQSPQKPSQKQVTAKDAA